MKIQAMKYLLPVLLASAAAGHAQAGVLDPDCTPEKAAKSAAAKATVGVGGRCDAKEAAKDSVGLNDRKDALGDGKNNDKDKLDDPLTRDKDERDKDDASVLEAPARKAAKAVIKP